MRRNLLLNLVVFFGFVCPNSADAQQLDAKLPNDKLDPTRLAADAHAELATWIDFPGFTADIEVSLAGKKAAGRIIVEPNGRLFVEHLPCQNTAWAKSKLCFLIHQQMQCADALQKKWAFAPRHPDQADFCVSPVDRQFDLCWQIRGGTIRAIEVRARDNRTCVNYLAFEKSPDGKSLPTVLVVHVWNGSKDQLKSSETQVRTWKRIRGFDLPASVDVVAGEISTPRQVLGSLRLSNHRVFENTTGQFAKR